MMTPDEVIDLITAMAVYDARHIGEADAAFWALQVGHLSYADCLRAVHEHYGDSDVRIMPVHVLRRVKAMREQRIAAAPVDTHGPDVDPDDARRWREALAEARRRLADGAPEDAPLLARSAQVLRLAIENRRDGGR